MVIREFPINCFSVCEQLGIIVIAYSKLNKKKREKAMKCSEDGFQIVREKSKGAFDTVIYYNDDMPHHRIRFTIMHEIGHIILDHTEHSELVESEANYFAKYALAPPPLIHNLGICDYVELAEKLDLSLQCAYYSMNKYFQWLKYVWPELSDYEITLISLFYPYLN